MDMIEPTTLALVSKALNAAVMRQAVHAHNIANANTEGFSPAKVSFEAQLSQVRDALGRGDRLSEADLRDSVASVVDAPAGTRVELDTEVAALAHNSLHYQALVKALDRQLSMMSLAVSDGKR
jgi:flagellar basal-body rod protein FlgB